MKHYSDEQIRELMFDALKTQEGIKVLLAMFNKFFPEEISATVKKIVNQEIDLNKKAIDEDLSNRILDNYNYGKRSMEDVKLLFRGKLSPEEVKQLKGK